ncbi:hypothetical protein [Pontibacter liquoris]|uniref:hypothetical protein n=1 Tax=Pontibacter liquoris TaxID=2905677 RepID=UPI001FA7166E|nr:hypothetical protein [Pontibacter liquoris]
MSNKVKLWALAIISLIASAFIISIFIKVVKVVLFAVLVLALAPFIYLVLRLLLVGGRKNR